MAPESGFWLVVRVPSMATRNCETHMPTAPQKSIGRRPHLSIAHIPGTVDTTLMLEVIIWMTNEFWMPELWKYFTPSRDC